MLPFQVSHSPRAVSPVGRELTLVYSWWVGYVGGVVCFDGVDLPQKMEIVELSLSIKLS